MSIAIILRSSMAPGTVRFGVRSRKLSNFGQSLDEWPKIYYLEFLCVSEGIGPGCICSRWHPPIRTRSKGLERYFRYFSETFTFYYNDLAIRNTAPVDGKRIAVWPESISGVSSVGPLEIFKDIPEKQERCYSILLSRTSNINSNIP
jgi:hypothetical protein